MLARRPVAQIDNGVLAGEPFACGILSPADKRKERMRSEASADNHPPNPVSNIKQPINTFDGRHILQENRRVESTFNHAFPSPLKYTEQPENRQRLLAESNKQFINLFGFRRTAIIQRPVVSGPPDFANDNEPDWREAA